MVEMSGIYVGHKRCDLTHGPSKTQIVTDAPKDNGGEGAAFSPTDLMGAALGSCMLTTMAIGAEKEGININIKGAKFHVTKEMVSNPRRIGQLTVKLELPASVPEAQRARVMAYAMSCPVHRSLHPDVKIPVEFSWNL